MQAVTITQITTAELETIIEHSVGRVLNELQIGQSSTPPNEQLLTIQQAADFLNLKVPTLYSKVSKNEIPYMKRGKRLYFSSAELMEYLKAGKRKSNLEIEADAESYLASNRK